MTVLPCVHYFLNLKLLALHSDFAMHRHTLMMFLIFLCSAVLDTARIPWKLPFYIWTIKKTHLVLVDTYFLLVALSGGLPVSMGSGRLSSLVLQENEAISKRSVM